MINSFIKHSKDAKSLKRENGVYLIRLLDAFANLTFSDYGIEPLLGKGAVSTFKSIISEPYVTDIMKNNEKDKI
jgi:hypothetical protein